MSNSLPDQDDESDSANFMDGYFSWDQCCSDDIQYDPSISVEIVGFSNDQNKKINKPGILPRNPKRSVDLSEHEQYFKDQYYKIFVSRKKFEKKLVRQIHNLVLVKEIKNLKKMDREEYRRIDLYFKKYSPSRKSSYLYWESKMLLPATGFLAVKNIAPAFPYLSNPLVNISFTLDAKALTNSFIWER